MSWRPETRFSLLVTLGSCRRVSSISLAPRICTNSHILSATSSLKPFSSTISFLTSSQGDLSSLSTALLIVRIFSLGTPHTSNIPSRTFL